MLLAYSITMLAVTLKRVFAPWGAVWYSVRCPDPHEASGGQMTLPRH